MDSGNPIPAHASGALASWRQRWDIVDERVSCRVCGASHSIEDARQPFTHYHGCTAASVAIQLPILELAKALREELSAMC
ncbi:hypothetical protein ALO90_200185 [Pseudomonas amygdali pv. aesculi]|nr:hypothetical protein ALO90_200185 [Pseudomonas amygdali pv. aesculi]